jgi:tRNA A-37 threonylcarbamoyl transferase component Bud32
MERSPMDQRALELIQVSIRFDRVINRKLIKIHNGEDDYSFVAKSATHAASSTAIEELIIDHTPSTVGYANSRKSIIKLVKPRSWHEKIKLAWGHSRIDKELQGFKSLQKLNIRTPEILYYGFRPLLSFRQKYIGFHITENLSLRGDIECYSLFCDGKTSASTRLDVIDNICSALLLLKSKRLVFTDFHLSNVFVDNENNITLIDPGLSKYYLNSGLNKKLSKSIHRFLSYHGDDFFTPDERERILHRFKLTENI